MDKKLSAKVRVYSVEGENYLAYKFKGRYYPLMIETEEDEKDLLYRHTEPCPYKAAMVIQNQYAPFFDKKEIRKIKKIGVLEAIFSF